MLKNKMILSSSGTWGLLFPVMMLVILINSWPDLTQRDTGCEKAKHTVFANLVADSAKNELSSSAIITGVRSVRIILPRNAGPVLKNIAALFVRQVRQRCILKVTNDGDAVLTIELAIEPGIGADGFRIADGKAGSIRITGNDERGVLYGVGKFLRTSRYDQGGFSPGTWRGTSVPVKPVRGIYFATHFHNYYDAAPIAEVQQYVEDVALWGYNVLLVWYDMHQFSGFNDPIAVKVRKRLHAILKAASSIGLDVAWGDVGNAGYNSSPANIRAVKCVDKGAQFDCDICPSQDGGTDYILANSEKLLEEFADVKPKYYFIWPYDNGGCCCDKCRPWGTNGYPRIARLLADQHQKHIPDARTIISTWYFSDDERQGFEAMLSKQSPAFADYLMSEANSVYVNATGIPLLAFPEITMLGWQPWGGYGAAPLPTRFQTEWRKKSQLLAGGFPYSEGIYDDLNKVLHAQFYWDPDRSATDIVREYIAFEYSKEVVDDMTRVIAILERNFKREEINESAEEAFRLIQNSEAKLTLKARRSWRWRLVFLRGFIDRQIFRTVPRPVFKQRGDHGIFLASIPDGAALSAAFKELRKIYHAEKIDQKDVNEVWLLPPQIVIDK